MANKIEQIIDLNFSKDDHGDTMHANLHIETDKGFRKDIRSEARVFWHGRNSRQHTFGLAGGGDFSKTLKTQPAIATQKNIQKQWDEVFTPESIAAITDEAKAWYESGQNKF
jgi:hypothetical protein